MKRLFLIVLLALAGCGGGGGSEAPAAAPDTAISAASAVSGDNQTAVVGTELSAPLVAVVRNAGGQALAGQTVTFKVVSGNGSVFAGATTSDASGVVRERWTLGTAAGVQQVQVRTIDSTGAALILATFTAVATPGLPQAFTLSAGNQQIAVQLQPLPAMARVRAQNSFGNPVPGVTVSFTPSVDGSVSAVSADTDDQGIAAVTWTLGKPIGAQVSACGSIRLCATLFFRDSNSCSLPTEPYSPCEGFRGWSDH